MAKTPEEYKELLLRPEWLELRKRVLFRDKFKCQECGRQSIYVDFPNYKRGLIMNVHHTKYIGTNPWDTPTEFLKTLCEDCHNLTHSNPEVADLFRAITKKLSANG